jgi:hypothetical protein
MFIFFLYIHIKNINTNNVYKYGNIERKFTSITLTQNLFYNNSEIVNIIYKLISTTVFHQIAFIK